MRISADLEQPAYACMLGKGAEPMQESAYSIIEKKKERATRLQDGPPSPCKEFTFRFSLRPCFGQRGRRSRTPGSRAPQSRPVPGKRVACSWWQPGPVSLVLRPFPSFFCWRVPMSTTLMARALRSPARSWGCNVPRFARDAPTSISDYAFPYQWYQVPCTDKSRWNQIT